MNKNLKISILTLLSILCLLIITSCDKKQKINKEGYIQVSGGKVWYQINGTGNGTPILLLHGGPGSSSFGFNPVKSLGNDRKIVFYDQLGSGHSDRIQDTTLMTVDHYIKEVEQVRKSLDMDEVILYGQSWGTALSLEYYLNYPEHVKGIIFSSPYFSTKRWIKDANKLVETLPDSVQKIIRVNEKNKTFSNPDYKNAVDLFYSKFLRRKERTQAQKDSASKFFGTNVYEYMWGPSEFTATGTLLDYDRIDKLSEIKVPVLFITGEYDEARPETVKYYQSLVPNAAYVEISNSGHATLNDNPKEVLPEVKKFSNSLDQNPDN